MAPTRQTATTERPLTLDDLPTPALLIEKTLLEANITRGKARAAEKSFRLRPHVKTVKSVEIARRMFDGGTGPITVSTLAEAEYFAGHGFADIFYAVPIVPSKLPRAAALARQGIRLTLLTDTHEGARMPGDSPDRLPTFIEVDVDAHRGGIGPREDSLIAAARALSVADVFAGLMAHAGGSYDGRSAEAAREHARREREQILVAADQVRAAGIAVPTLTIGSTPTMLHGDDYTGIDEVRAGVFMFFDLVMAGVGVCTPQDIALSVLTSVIGQQPSRGRFFVDAGWMALSRDRGTQNQPTDYGYGMVLDEDGRPIDDLIVKAAFQEHGVVERLGGGPIDVTRFPIGRRLRVLPNHACAMAGQHDAYHLVDGHVVIEQIARIRGW